MANVISYLQIMTVLVEFFLPWYLKRFCPGYDPKKMAMSLLGAATSPVSNLYSGWLIILGVILSLSSASYFTSLSSKGKIVLAVLTSGALFLFALGAGILAGIFKVDADDKMRTLPSRIHGYSSAIGFMALLFFPRLRSIAVFEDHCFIIGILYLLIFSLSVLFFVLFVMSDKKIYKGTAIDREGTWERLTLLFLYLPIVIDSIMFLSSTKIKDLPCGNHL